MTAAPGRRSALRRSLALWFAFVVLVVIGVVTVLVPELEDDSNEEGAPTEGAAARPS